MTHRKQEGDFIDAYDTLTPRLGLAHDGDGAGYRVFRWLAWKLLGLGGLEYFRHGVILTVWGEPLGYG